MMNPIGSGGFPRLLCMFLSMRLCEHSFQPRDLGTAGALHDQLAQPRRAADDAWPETGHLGRVP